MLTLVLGAALLFASCISADEAEVTTEGDATAFCSSWPETRAALQRDLGASEEWELRTEVDSVRRALEQADLLAPAALESDWAAASDFSGTVIKLLEIADFRPERLPQELIDVAFGVGGAEAAAAASEAAIARIDAWAVAECGDLCESWPRLRRALGWEGSGGGGTEQSIVVPGATDRSTIELAAPLIPDAIRANWDVAADLKLGLIELYSEVDWETVNHEALRRRHLEELGLTDDSLGNLTERRGMPEGYGDPLWWASELLITGEIDAIEAWLADSCESVGLAGLPGVVTVEDPGRSVDQLLIAALPVGADIREIEDASGFLGAACTHLAPGEVWSSPLLERSDGFDRVCVSLDRIDMSPRPAVLPAGEYDLFIGSFPGGAGSFNSYVPAPERCVVMRLTVDGDTRVQVPSLEPCDLGPLAGTAEEIARRQTPLATSGGTGTLSVALTEHLADEGVHVWYNLVVLPSGTTLDQIGLGEVWPVGAACLPVDRPIDAHFSEQDTDLLAELEREDREAEAQAAQRQTERDELERQAAELQQEREELDRQAAELDQLSGAQRQEAEGQLAERQAQLEDDERRLAEHQAQLEDGERQAEEAAAQRQEQREGGGDDAVVRAAIQEAIAGGGVPVPITPFPTDPENQECGGGPHEYLGLNDAWIGPELAQLPAADYDVYVFVDLYDPEEGDVPSRNECAEFTVSVSGETETVAPPLEDCP